MPIDLFDCIFANLENFISKPVMFLSFILIINPFLHVYYIEFSKNIFIFTNFEFSQKFSVKSQIFLYIEIVPIRFEWGEVKKVPGNKILLRSILEQCEVSRIHETKDEHKQRELIYTIKGPWSMQSKWACPTWFIKTATDSGPKRIYNSH